MAPEFFFDLDDTLIYNQYMYTKVYADFIDFMLKKINAKSSSKKQSRELLEIVKHTSPKCKGLEEIITIYKMDRTIRDMFSVVSDFNNQSKKDNPKNPFNKERVPNALKNAYFAICNDPRFSCTPLEYEANEAYELGKGFYNVKRELVDGAEEVLEFLKGKNCALKLYTCGDVWLQNQKININGFDKYFEKKDRIIVPTKDKCEIKAYLNGHDPNQTFMVGNSVRHDIAPAVKSGIKAIYFPSATFYSWDEIELDEEHKSKLLVINDLREIISNYDLLASLK